MFEAFGFSRFSLRCRNLTQLPSGSCFGSMLVLSDLFKSTMSESDNRMLTLFLSVDSKPQCYTARQKFAANLEIPLYICIISHPIHRRVVA